ncbi:MAG: aminopeptidase P family protein [Gammaproteobacteria bacterium]
MDAVVISAPAETAETFRARRRIAARNLGDGALILKSAPVQNDGRDGAHPYRPDKYLYYLTGFAEPESALLLQIRDGNIKREILLCRRRDARAEQWDGGRAGPLRARRQTGIAESGDIAEFRAHLDALLHLCETAHYLPGVDRELDLYLCKTAAARRLQNRGEAPVLRAMSDASVALDEMRAVKSSEEIALLRRAAEITAAGHRAAMRAAKRAKTECEIEAALGAAFRAAGARHSFAPIVAAGRNARTLHYHANDGRIFARDLILVDAGAEYREYAGDMSRTFPADGIFSPPQAALYDVVLSAQKHALAAIRPGAKWDAAENTAARALSRGLAALGICKGGAKTIFARKLYRRFYMHRVGHFIGLDVHDVGRMTEDGGGARILRSGMALTVEPGLYIPDAADIPREYRGIGIRIEDVAVVRPGGCEVLPGAPKTRAEIEKCISG